MTNSSTLASQSFKFRLFQFVRSTCTLNLQERIA